jgi:hypothetical protein
LKPPEIIDGRPTVNLDRVYAGEEDLCFTVKGPDEMDRAVDWILAREDKFASLVIDGYNLGWEDHMDLFNEKFGGDIQGGQWRVVKRPWKARQKRLMRSPMNIGFSAWLRDTAYDQIQAHPGAKATLNIHAQEVAAIEKSVPYTVDIVFQMRVKTDKLNCPTVGHEIIVAKARRPRTIDPKDLYIGQKFQWRSDRQEDLWALAVAPFVDRWKDSALTGVVDYIGMDAEEAIMETREVLAAASEGEAGKLIQTMIEAFEKGELKDMEAFKALWQSAIAPTINLLSAESQHAVNEVKEMIKNKIEGGND